MCSEKFPSKDNRFFEKLGDVERGEITIFKLICKSAFIPIFIFKL